MIYKNCDIEKEMAHTDLEREAIEDFYEEYRLNMLENWKVGKK